MIAAVRNVDKAKNQLSVYVGQIDFVAFDFENQDSFNNAFEQIDVVFLLRPPHISDVNRVFEPLINYLVGAKIKQVVFLSVQGVEKSKIIPHHKIEKLLIASGLDYIFVRPSYFMQNLTTTLLQDIQEKRKIILPAGKAKFNWVDVGDIGLFTALMLTEFEQYKNQAFEVTCHENKNFEAVARFINAVVEDKIEYKNMNPICFYRYKKKMAMPKGLILVMIMLHFLPRFQKEPNVSKAFEEITGQEPTSLKEFITREQAKFQNKTSNA
ncbi:MAG: NmrA family NAD(P)-binding protein [Aureispira sp.]|nr:NmrA family NAD(P)-binding protein [Aureispira sp.]